MHRSREIAAGLTSLATLLTVEIGLPIGIWWLYKSLVPQVAPGGIDHALSDPSATLVLALFAASAAGWAAFTFSLLTEAAARARRVRAPHLPGLGGTQRWAASLIAGIALLLPTAGASLAATAPAASVTATHAPASTAVAAAGQAAAHTDATALSPQRTTTTYVVRHNDNLWSIAERQLGNGKRWREIADLNDHRYFDGQPFNPNRIQPGWDLTLPATNASATTTPATTPPGAGVHDHIVQEGENLSEIADEVYGPGHAQDYTIIFAANQGHVLDGHRVTDPNDIYNGQDLQIPPLPGTAAPSATQPSSPPPATTPAPAAKPTTPAVTATSPVATPSPGPSSPSAASTTAPDTGPSQAGSTTESSPTVTEPSIAATPTHPTPAASSGHDAPATSHGADAPIVMILATLGALAAAGLLSGLGLRRIHQQRSRRTAERIALPASPETAAFEEHTRAAQDPAGVEGINHALREIAAHHGERGWPLPTLRTALYQRGKGLTLDLQEPGELDSPWICADPQRRTWRRRDLRAAPTSAPAPYPALITLGTTSEGASVLVNLEAAGTITVSGHEGERAQILERLALELADSPWADHLHLHLAGFGEQTAAALSGERLTHHRDLDSALDELSAWTTASAEQMTTGGHEAMRTARLDAGSAAIWPTCILLTNTTLTSAQLARLNYIMTTTPAPAVAAVVPAAPGADGGPWTIPAHFDQPVTIPALDYPVTLARLTRDQHRLALDLLSTSSQPAEMDQSWLSVIGSAAAPAAPTALPQPPTPPTPTTDPPPPASVPPAPAPTVPGWASGASPLGPLPAALTQPLGQPQTAEPVDGDDTHNEQTAPATIEAEAETEGEAFEEETHSFYPVQDTVAGTRPGPRIHLLGPVHVTGAAGTIPSNRSERVTEMCTYIALYPNRSHQSMVTAIWPGARTQNHHPWVSRLRTWFGTDEEGRPYLPSGSYRFAESVTCDWDDFLAAVGDGDLDAALSLVTGRPFQDTHPERYVWAEYPRQEMISKIVDVATTCASRHLDEHEHLKARTAATVGLTVCPESEPLACILMIALYHSGNRNEALEVAQRILATCEDLEVDPEPDTLDAISYVRGERRGSASVVGSVDS